MDRLTLITGRLTRASRSDTRADVNDPVSLNFTDLAAP